MHIRSSACFSSVSCYYKEEKNEINLFETNKRVWVTGLSVAICAELNMLRRESSRHSNSE